MNCLHPELNHFRNGSFFSVGGGLGDAAAFTAYSLLVGGLDTQRLGGLGLGMRSYSPLQLKASLCNKPSSGR